MLAPLQTAPTVARRLEHVKNVNETSFNVLLTNVVNVISARRLRCRERHGAARVVA
jgi:hypothetical protein